MKSGVVSSCLSRRRKTRRRGRSKKEVLMMGDPISPVFLFDWNHSKNREQK